MNKEILDRIEKVRKAIMDNPCDTDKIDELKQLLDKEKSESTWEMFRRLQRVYGIRFSRIIPPGFIMAHSEQKAKNIMKEIEKGLTNGKRRNTN